MLNPNGNSDGRCSAWAQLFHEVLDANGIDTSEILKVEADTSLYPLADSLLIKEWKKHFSIDRPVFPGLGTYRLPWKETLEEIEDVRQCGLNGLVFFAASSLDNRWESLKAKKFYYPALLPPMPWKDNIAPLVPENFNAEKTRQGVQLNWSPAAIAADGDVVQQYVIYRSKVQNINTNLGQKILAVLKSDCFSYLDNSKDYRKGYYYCITAIDDCENESEPAGPVKPGD